MKTETKTKQDIPTGEKLTLTVAQYFLQKKYNFFVFSYKFSYFTLLGHL